MSAFIQLLSNGQNAVEGQILTEVQLVRIQNLSSKIKAKELKLSYNSPGV